MTVLFWPSKRTLTKNKARNHSQPSIFPNQTNSKWLFCSSKFSLYIKNLIEDEVSKVPHFCVCLRCMLHTSYVCVRWHVWTKNRNLHQLLFFFYISKYKIGLTIWNKIHSSFITFIYQNDPKKSRNFTLLLKSVNIVNLIWLHRLNLCEYSEYLEWMISFEKNIWKTD